MLKKLTLGTLLLAVTLGLTAAPAEARHHHRGYYGGYGYSPYAYSPYSTYSPYGYSSYGYSSGYSPYYGASYAPNGYYDNGYYNNGYGYGYGYRRHHSALPYILGAAALGYALSR